MLPVGALGVEPDKVKAHGGKQLVDVIALVKHALDPNTPLAPVTRGRVARELLAMVRGTTVTRSRDEMTIAARLVDEAC